MMAEHSHWFAYENTEADISPTRRLPQALNTPSSTDNLHSYPPTSNSTPTPASLGRYDLEACTRLCQIQILGAAHARRPEGCFARHQFPNLTGYYGQLPLWPPSRAIYQTPGQPRTDGYRRRLTNDEVILPTPVETNITNRSDRMRSVLTISQSPTRVLDIYQLSERSNTNQPLPC